MRILVCSDTHGSTDKLEKMILSQPDAKHIIFLGDGVRDVETISYIYDDRYYHIVSGNCDYCSQYPYIDFLTVDNKKLLFTHGHTLSVKHTLQHAVHAANNVCADVLLFGHTHSAMTEYRDGLHIMNPGSLSRPRNNSKASYGFIDIVDGQIFTAVVEI